MLGRDGGRRRLQRGVEGGIGRRADRLADPDDVEAAEQVGERDAQQLVPAQPAHHAYGPIGVGLALHRLDHRRAQLRRRARNQLVVAGQHLQGVGRPRQHLGHVAAGRQQVGQP